MTIKIKKLHPEAQIPKYQTKGSSGFDLHAVEDYEILQKSTSIINTGLAFQVPENFELQVRSRSGLAAKYCVFVLNSPGTIDSDFIGEVKIILQNLSTNTFFVKKGDRIAQGVIAPISQVHLMEVEELTPTERGEGGLGSTKV